MTNQASGCAERLTTQEVDFRTEMTDAAMRREESLPGRDEKAAAVQGDMTPPRALPFVIRRDGTWLYRGSPVKRKEMLCLFGSMLTRDAQGRFWLRTPTEAGTIHVEDAPFIVRELDFRGGCGRQQNLCLRTNMDELLCVGPSHPLIVDWDHPPSEDCAAIPYVQVRRGEGDQPILARLSRPVYYELVALAVPGHVGCRPCMGVWSHNRFFPLAPMPALQD